MKTITAWAVVSEKGKRRNFCGKWEDDCLFYEIFETKRMATTWRNNNYCGDFNQFKVMKVKIKITL